MQSNPSTPNALTQTKAIASRAAAFWHRARLQGNSPIGLDFGHKSINAVQLHRRGTSLCIAAAGSVAYSAPREDILSDPKRLHSLIHQLLNSSPFKGKEVVVSAPIGEPKILSLSLKSTSPQGIPKLVMDQVKERLGGEDQDWLVDYLPVKLNKSTQDTTVMVAAMQRHSSLAFIKNVQSSGLYLNALEIAPQALQRLLTLIDDPQPNCLVMNFGYESTYLSHFLEGRLTMDREISLGSEDFITPICQSLSLEKNIGKSLFYTLGFGEDTEISPLVNTAFKRLKVQIDRMNQYISSQLHGDKIDCIYLTGDAANWPHANRAFSASFGYKTKTLNAFELLNNHPNVLVQDTQQATLSIATGLAMRWSA